MRYYHATDADLRPGDHITPPLERGAAPAHPARDAHGNGSSPSCTYMTSSLRGTARWGERVYVVAPLGPVWEDWNWEDSYECDGHLVVVEALDSERR
jgi:hypothetical protein